MKTENKNFTYRKWFCVFDSEEELYYIYLGKEHWKKNKLNYITRYSSEIRAKEFIDCSIDGHPTVNYDEMKQYFIDLLYYLKNSFVLVDEIEFYHYTERLRECKIFYAFKFTGLAHYESHKAILIIKTDIPLCEGNFTGLDVEFQIDKRGRIVRHKTIEKIDKEIKRLEEER